MSGYVRFASREQAEEEEEEEDSSQEEEEEEEQEPDDMVDKYRLIEELSSGSFSAVFRGENVRTGGAVAVKTERIDNDLGLLRHEIQMYMRLRGTPSIFLPKWYGVSRNQLRCLVLPMGAPSLKVAAQDAAMARLSAANREDLARRVFAELVAALAAVHARGVLHRDVKPANVLVDFIALMQQTSSNSNSNSNRGALKLIDLGLATPFTKGLESLGRRPSALIGSPAYASMAAHACAPPAPEQDMESACYVSLFMQRGGNVPWTTTGDVGVVDAAMAAGGEWQRAMWVAALGSGTGSGTGSGDDEGSGLGSDALVQLARESV